MRILVTGATGFAGSMLVPRLLADGHELRALVRDPARLSLAPGAQVEVVRGDALTGEGLARALEDVEVAYYLIHSMERSAGEAKNAGGFPERELLAAETFAAAARRAGVARIVYLGGLVPQTEHASRHLASRESVERVLLEAVPDSVALRASIVIGARSRSFRFLVHLVERMPLLALPSWHRFRTQPVDARDVNELLARAASAPIVGERSLDVAGPDVLTYGEIIEAIVELMIVNRPALRLGVSLTPIAARVAAAIAGEDPELILALMEGLQGDLLASPTRPDAAALLGVRLHNFASAVEHSLRAWEALESLRAR